MPTTSSRRAPILQHNRAALPFPTHELPSNQEKLKHTDDNGIVQLGADILKKISQPLSSEEAEVIYPLWEKLENTLKVVMNSHTFHSSAGISAVQIGILKRACLIWTPATEIRHIANPTLVSHSRLESIEFEGCLSFFDKRGLVPRAEVITISYLDRNLKPCEEQFRGWAARIILHEMDHMDGILYTGRMRQQDKLISIEEYKAFRSRQNNS